MSSINIRTVVPTPRTFAGAPATQSPPVEQLRRAVMTCMLWEGQFYENGVAIADRIAQLVHQIPLRSAGEIAIEARTKMKLRHVPLLIVREMARHAQLRTAPEVVRQTLHAVIQRPDEITEFLAIYWKDGKCPLSAQVKKGLAAAFTKFSEYELAKYNRDKDVKLRDVLFLCHSKPADVPKDATKWTKTERALYKPVAAAFGTGVNTLNRDAVNRRTQHFTDGEMLYAKLVDGQLETPDTWEVALSGGANKGLTFRRLMSENKLGALAFLRNLRNMTQADIDTNTIRQYGNSLNFERTLPFRFVAAANTNPSLEHIIEPWMLKCLEGQAKLFGRTVFLIDVSGSMFGTRISARAELDRFDAAAALTILGRELCEDVGVFTFSQSLAEVATRRGFALRDAMRNSQSHGNTYLGRALQALKNHTTWDRLIVITDEQSADQIPLDLPGQKYMINVASYTNSIATNEWVKISGWSEAVIDYIRMSESMG